MPNNRFNQYLLFLVGVGFLTATHLLDAQPGPAFAKAPPRFPYKPVPPSKEIPIRPCSSEVINHSEPGVFYKAEKGLIAPKITQDVEVGLTNQGKDAYAKNLFKDPNDVASKISVLIDLKGKPQSMCLESPAGFDLDQQAANAIRQYRFKPAEKLGTPVVMRITIVIIYQTH